MLRVIGDTHGCIEFCRYGAYDENVRREERCYLDIIKPVEYSLQLGDMGFSDSYEALKRNDVDPSKHKFIGGNHDDYDNPSPNMMGDFGIALHGGVEFAWIRGERSVDMHYRVAREMAGEKKTWWKQEEFTYEQAEKCLDFFQNIGHVKIMLAHGCPDFVFKHGVLTNEDKIEPSFQSKLLSAVCGVCKVDNWIFGHHHNNWRQTVNDTNFICVNELCYLDIQDDGTIGETK